VGEEYSLTNTNNPAALKQHCNTAATAKKPAARQLNTYNSPSAIRIQNTQRNTPILAKLGISSIVSEYSFAFSNNPCTNLLANILFYICVI
jgi:hypothetical protein